MERVDPTTPKRSKRQQAPSRDAQRRNKQEKKDKESRRVSFSAPAPTSEKTNDEADTAAAGQECTGPDLTNLVLPPRLELDHPLVKTPSFRAAQSA